MASDPTVPKVILVPSSVPVRGTVWGGGESLIVPFNVLPVCRHVNVNVPWKVPLYCPDHRPDRFVAAAFFAETDTLFAVDALVVTLAAPPA